MPRKKKSEKNCHKNIVCMKVTDIELEILNQHATTAGLSRSEYLRKLFLEEEIHVHYEVVADMKIGSVKNFVALVKNGSFLVRIIDMTILIEKEFIYGSSKRPNRTDYYRK